MWLVCGRLCMVWLYMYILKNSYWDMGYSYKAVLWNLSIKDTLKECPLNEDSVCSPNYIELCTQINLCTSWLGTLLYTGQPAGSRWCPLYTSFTCAPKPGWSRVRPSLVNPGSTRLSKIRSHVPVSRTLCRLVTSVIVKMAYIDGLLVVILFTFLWLPFYFTIFTVFTIYSYGPGSTRVSGSMWLG